MKSEVHHKIWGENIVAMSPFYFGSLRLRYCLSALKRVHGRVLEIGCGAGAFVRAIKKYRPDLTVTGCDIDHKAISNAQNIDKNSIYLEANAQKLPFRSGKYNAVIAIDVIEHLDEPQTAFNEAYRVLNEKGILYASIPLEGSFFTLHGWFKKIGFIPKEIYAGHIQQYNKGKLERLISEAGFTKMSIFYSGHCLQQIADFIYFTLLFLTRSKPGHTVEGYIDQLDTGLANTVLKIIRAVASFLFFLESILLKRVPGLIGHFTAVK